MARASSCLSKTGVDPELSGDIDAKLIDEINKRVEAKESLFNQALMENDAQNGAIQSLCAEIYTDMTEVAKDFDQPEGLVSLFRASFY